MRKVHPHRRAFAEDRRRAAFPALDQAADRSAADGRRDGPRGTSTGCRGPSGRCVAPGRPASESPGDGRRRQRTGQRVAHPRGGRGEEDVDRLVEAAVQQMHVAVVRHQPVAPPGVSGRW